MLTIASTSHANIAQDMDDFFNGIGFASNTTNLQAVENQASGFYGGGNLYARTPVRYEELVTLDLPNYRAGCGGIDLYTGSMSYISGDKLTNLGKQIMTNTAAYAVDVMLATTVPELKQVRDFLQQTLQKVNQSTINSCEMAQNLVGGVWPKTVASQQKICNDQMRMGRSGSAHDYVSARMQCSADNFNEAIEEASKDKTHKKAVVMNKNLMWSWLQEKSFLQENNELAELIMSLTGTIIIDKDGHITEIAGVNANQDIIEMLLGEGGAKAQVWHCDEYSKCLHVSKATLNFAASHGLKAKVKNLIFSINEKLKTDTKLTTEEQGFIAMTSIPVLKFLIVLNSLRGNDAAVDLEAYASLIAHNLITQYLKELIQTAATSAFGSQFNEDLVKKLSKKIEYAYQSVAAIEPKVSKNLMQKIALIEHMQTIEKQVAHQVGEGMS